MKNATITVAPNPWEDHTFLWIDQLPASRGTIRIFDLSGRQLLESDVALSPNQKQRIRIERADLPTGMFLLQLTNEEGLILHSEKLFIR